MAFYDDMQNVATGLLTSFNQGVITLTRSVPGTVPNADEPWITNPPTETVHPIKGVVKAVSKKYIDGTTILSTDSEVTIAAFAIEPNNTDKLTIDGVDIQVIDIKRIPAAGTLVVTKIIVRI